jgi:alpha-tubulin suppressor-like RCC1 family protein
MTLRSLSPIRPAFRLVLLPAALIGLALLALLAAPPAAHAQAPGYTDVSAGRLFTCAVKSGGDVACWGLNLWDQAPDLVTGPFSRVSAGGYHGCALRPNGTIACWGDDGEGMGVTSPPGGVFTQISAAFNHSCGLRSNGDIDCWGAPTWGKAADQVGPFVQVSAGYDHTCAVRSGGVAFCWGGGTTDTGISPNFGQSIVPPGVTFTQVSAGQNHTCGIKTDGGIMCWGGDTWGQSTPPAGTFKQVAAGYLHTCAIRADDSLTCWGYNLYGVVGHVPAGTFTQVSSGLGHSCALSTDDLLYCWGRNDFGQTKIPNLGGPSETFNWEGLYPPVEADPALNTVKAGSAVPLKFSLGGDYGLDVLDLDSPASQPLDCTLLNPSGELAPTRSAGGTGLSYDAASDRYSYVWKTDKAWAGTCRVLSLTLTDETEHRVAFRFR